MHLWAKATRTTVYVHNRISHNALGNKTVEEMFTGENPEVNHLKVFDVPVYLHIPKEKRSKLETLGKQGIFVGYNEQSKYYRIYILPFFQIEISIIVTFDEDATFTKSRNIIADEYHEEQEAPRTT